MNFREKSGRLRALVSFLAVILFFLLVADVYFLSRQRSLIREEAKNHTVSELNLMGILLKEALLKGDYATIERFLASWAEHHRDIVHIKAVAANGFVIFGYTREGDYTDVFTTALEVSYHREGRMSLRVTKDFTTIDAHFRRLIFQHIGLSLVFTAIMSAILWTTLKKTAFTPMDEMLHEIRRMNEELESRVEERTKQLVSINEELEDEITERKKAEDRLQESQRYLSSIIENAPVCIKLLEPDGTVLDMNPSGLQMLDAGSADAVIGKNMLDFLTDDSRERMISFLARVCSGEKGSTEYSAVGLKGKRKLFESYAVPLYDPAKKRNLMLSLTRDITEQRKIEEQLRHSQKMEVLGTLTGGIAHEFNNILSAVLGYSEFVQEGLEQSSPLRKYMDNIISAGQRAVNLTRGLLAFSRKQIMTFGRVAANEIIENMGRLIPRLIGEDVVLQIFLTEKDTTFSGDPGQMEQVILNLVANSRDAMPKGGTLTILTDKVSLDDDFVRRYGYGRPGEYVLISVTDTGTGMSEDVRQKIFEPFFTTKKVGKGTGLGLSMVDGIVKQHAGYIQLYSEPGFGTTVKIFLPAAEPEGAESSIPDTETPAGGSETILVGEDDPEVRAFLKGTLEQAGYSVIEAENGDTAVSMYRKYGNAIDLLLLDVVMPGRDGKEVLDKIRETDPDMKALFISGYTRDVFERKGFPATGVDFLSKPMTRADLLGRIRKTLDSA